MEPARSIIKRLGGEAAVARITQTAFTAPYRWQHSKERGGTGGLVPQRHIPTLLNYAREHGVSLTADDFLPAPLPSPTPTGEAA